MNTFHLLIFKEFGVRVNSNPDSNKIIRKYLSYGLKMLCYKQIIIHYSRNTLPVDILHLWNSAAMEVCCQNSETFSEISNSCTAQSANKANSTREIV